METYSKHVQYSELKIHLLASSANLAPKILSVEICEDHWIITIERYPTTLFDHPYVEWEKWREQILHLFKELHEIRILHGDISEENIVVDSENNRVALIDFGMSRLIFENDSMNQEEFCNEIKEINFMFDSAGNMI